MLRNEEIDWWLYRVRYLQPELWDIFANFIPAGERHDLLEAYWRRMTGDDKVLALDAARHWAIYEGSCCTLLPNPEFTDKFAEDKTAWAVARLEAHYFRNVQPEPDSLLLDRVPLIRQVPAYAIHGRYDIVCPVKSLLDLASAWPELDWEIAPQSGHSSHEAEITKALTAATRRIMQTGSPKRP
jgi:proline iminopeptidase